MARSIWNGTIAFGLMTGPEELPTATETETFHFHEVALSDAARIEHRRFCSKEDNEDPYNQGVKGYEVAEDEYVVLEKEEVAAAAVDGAHRIDVEPFVDAADIDPVFFDKTYWLGAGDDGGQPYRLLHDALAKTGRAGIGRFTFHDREYLTAVRARDGVLVLHTLRFADELVDAGEIDVATPSRGPGDREVKMAAQLIDTLHEKFEPDKYEDEYRAAVLEVIERKAKGEEIVVADEPEADSAPDLMATLKASLDGAKKGGGRWPARCGPARSASASSTCRSRSTAPCATSTCTSASSTRRTARRSTRAGSAPRRTRRFPTRRSATATTSTTASRSCSPTTTSPPPRRARRGRSTSRRSSTSTRSTRSTSTTLTTSRRSARPRATCARTGCS